LAGVDGVDEEGDGVVDDGVVDDGVVDDGGVDDGVVDDGGVDDGVVDDGGAVAVVVGAARATPPAPTMRAVVTKQPTVISVSFFISALPGDLDRKAPETLRP
jgi:hypothetical protein